MNGEHPDSGGLHIRPAPQQPDDYRILLTAGPFDLQARASVEFEVAMIAAGDMRDPRSGLRFPALRVTEFEHWKRIYELSRL